MKQHAVADKPTRGVTESHGVVKQTQFDTLVAGRHPADSAAPLAVTNTCRTPTLGVPISTTRIRPIYIYIYIYTFIYIYISRRLSSIRHRSIRRTFQWQTYRLRRRKTEIIYAKHLLLCPPTTRRAVSSTTLDPKPATGEVPFHYKTILKAFQTDFWHFVTVNWLHCILFFPIRR